MLKEATVIGYVGADPEIIINKITGVPFSQFRLGINLKNRQGVKRTDWIQINCNDYFHDFANQYIKKGMQLMIRGYFKASAYVHKDTNSLMVNEIIYPSKIIFLSSKKDLEESVPPDFSTDQLGPDDVPTYNPADDDVPY